ncbi:MAG: hypothetical protein AB1466_04155 [Actinomycetota bacterium]
MRAGLDYDELSYSWRQAVYYARMAWNLFPLYQWTSPICGMYIHYDPDSTNDVFVNYYAARKVRWEKE